MMMENKEETLHKQSGKEGMRKCHLSKKSETGYYEIRKSKCKLFRMGDIKLVMSLKQHGYV